MGDAALQLKPGQGIKLSRRRYTLFDPARLPGRIIARYAEAFLFFRSPLWRAR
jgi:hypothetical protein